jgi:hypothetical protein
VKKIVTDQRSQLGRGKEGHSQDFRFKSREENPLCIVDDKGKEFGVLRPTNTK